MVQSKADREKQKLIADKCQSLIEVLLKDEDNKYCVDCDAKGPRWASWNLGIFLCIRCAGIHRNLGVHISKVKSVNLDAWTPEHVAYMQRMGNSRARAIYEANLPDDFRRPQSDTSLESFIRAKYEHKKYIAQDYVDPGPPQPAFNIDEELKKMKEQKRSKLSSSGTTRVLTVPELPPNPKPRPTVPSNANLSLDTPDLDKKTKGTGALADLLDLDLSSSSGQQVSSTTLNNNLFDLQQSINPMANISAAMASSNNTQTNSLVSTNDNKSALELLSGVNLTSTSFPNVNSSGVTHTTNVSSTINSSLANLSINTQQMQSQQTASNKNSFDLTFDDPFGDLVTSKPHSGTNVSQQATTTTAVPKSTTDESSTLPMAPTTVVGASSNTVSINSNITPPSQGVNLSNLIDF